MKNIQRISIVKFSLICVLALTLHICVNAQWTNIGPDGTGEKFSGVIKELYFHKGSNKLFASSPDGGLWTLNTTTQLWNPISDYIDNIEIRAFAVAPSVAGGNTIYLANKSFSLYRSFDGGSNWTKLTAFDRSFGRVNRLLVHNSNFKVLFVATTTGLWKSTDSGNTFAPVIDFKFQDVLDIKMDSLDSNIIYIGVRKQGVYKTTNGSVTWGKLLDWTTPTVVDNSSNPPKTSPSQMIEISLGVRNRNGTAESASTRTVAVRFGTNIKISRDGGITFADKTPAEGYDICGNFLRSEDFTAQEWTGAIGVDPFNSDRILIGSCRIKFTVDGGNTWQSPAQQKHEDIQHIQFNSIVKDEIFIANDGGVEKSTTPSPSFRPFNNYLTVHQFFRVGINGETAIGNFDHNGIHGTHELSSRVWGRVVGVDCGYSGNGMEKDDIYKDPKRNDRFYFLTNNHLGRINYSYTNLADCNGNAHVFAPFTPYIIYPFPERLVPGPALEKSQQPIAVDTRANSQLILFSTDGFNSELCMFTPNREGCLPPPYTYNLMLTRTGDREPTGTNNVSNPTAVTNLPDWEVTTQSVNDPFVSTAFSGSNAFAITRSGSLFTANIPLPAPSAVNWVQKNGFVTNNEDGVRHFALGSNDMTIYAITKSSVVTTSNLGDTWRIMNTPNYLAKNYSIYFHNNRLNSKIYVATGDGVYEGWQHPAGISWTKINGNLPNVKVVQLVKDGSYLYAVTFGRGLWRMSLP
jgi:hypothetical protein